MRRFASALWLLGAAACDCGGPATRQSAGAIGFAPDLQFGTVLVGSSKTLVSRVTNAGGGALVVERFETQSPFSTSAEGFVLSGGESREIEVRYAPTEPNPMAADAHRATLTAVNDSEDPRARINLAGRAVVPPVSAPGELDFGEVAVGELRTLDLEVVNRGTETFAVLQASLASASFVGEVDRLRRGYAPGQEDSVLLTFQPEAEGIHRAEVLLKTDHPAQPEVKVALVGVGLVPQLELCYGPVGEVPRCLPRTEAGQTVWSDGLDFGAVEAGRSAAAEIRVVNRGKLQVSLHGLASASGAMVDDETQRRNPCRSSAPRENFSFEPPAFPKKLPEDPTPQDPRPASAHSMRVTYLAGHECRDDVADRGRVAVGVGRLMQLELRLFGASRVGLIQTRDLTLRLATAHQTTYEVQNLGLGPLTVAGAEIVEGDAAKDCERRAACPVAGRLECDAFRFAAPPVPRVLPGAATDGSGNLLPSSGSVGDLVFDPAGLGGGAVAVGFVRVRSDDPYLPAACGKLTGQRP